MKQKKNTPHILDIGGIKIKVYQIGGTPVIKNAEPESAPMRIHTHFTYEIFFITEGTLMMTVGEDSYKLGKGICIIPPYLKHCSSHKNDNSFCLLFSLEASHDGIRKQLDRGMTLLPISEEICFYIRTLASKATQRDTELLTELIFNGVFSLLAPEHNRPALPAPREHISAIESFINTNYKRKLTLQDVADHVYLSTKQVSRILEKEYGMGFSELVTNKRMASAEAMLINTDLKISQIAAELFCDTPTYFYTLFRKKHGTSPLNYRKSMREHKRSQVSAAK